MKFLLIFAYLFVNTVCSPIVEIDSGKLLGTTYPLPDGRIFTAFLGIPFAAPPIYKRRFMPPQKIEPWIGVFNASTFPSVCLQYTDFSFSVEGDEDCLYLNVYTPKLPKEGDQLLDVMVYIHGGAFMFGDGTNAFPDYILNNNNIVFVAMNYRLGILGFMSTGTSVIPGNNGLKDQVAAMKWVKKNIKKFGGNPDSITLAGSSAGGASVHYHFLSNTTNGLFHRGISFSGSTLLPWTLPRNNTEKSIHVAAMVGCPTCPHEELVRCLRQRPARQIVEIARHFTAWRYEPFTTFGPTVEPENPDAFLTEDPLQVMQCGKMKDLPFLISMCKDEGLYRGAEYAANKSLLEEVERNWNSMAPNMLMYNYSVSTEAEKDQVSAAIRKYYFGDCPVTENVKQLVQALGDRKFYNGIVKAMKIQAGQNKQQVYCYKFSYRGKYSVSNFVAKNFENYGVSHADDVCYIIALNKLGNYLEMPSDRAMVEFLGKIVVNFMKQGNPKFGNVNWEPVSKNPNDKFHCLNICSTQEYGMVDFEDPKTAKFWEDLLPLENACSMR